MYRLRDDLTFGIAYRSPTWAGDVSGGRGKASLFGLLPIDLGGVQIENLRLPQRVSAGLAWDATDRLKLVGEVRWLNYRNSSLDTLNVKTARPIEMRVGLPLKYRNMWVFIAGAEYRLDAHWTASLGYNYGTQPVAESGLLPMGSTLAQHHITAGLRYARDNWWVGGGYMVGFAPTLHNDGVSAIPLGIDYSGSSIKQVQHSVLIGFGFSFGPRESKRLR
jgi:long-subunit fatty acid transport protein